MTLLCRRPVVDVHVPLVVVEISLKLLEMRRHVGAMRQKIRSKGMYMSQWETYLLTMRRRGRVRAIERLVTMIRSRLSGASILPTWGHLEH